MAMLTVEEGPGRGAEVEIPRDGEIVIGRAGHCQISIPDSKASRTHCRVEGDGDEIIVTDLASQNGTYVNGVRIDEATTVRVGDTIRVGNSTMRLREGAAGELTGRTLAGYEVEQRLGFGGMGEVYRAKQVSLGRTVALKILSRDLTTDRHFVRRFVEEARSAGQLNHPNVVHVYDVGDEDGYYYYSMEYLPGGTVQHLAEEGAMEPVKAVDIALQAARALEYAETKGIIHCDVKPGNLMLDAEGQVRLADLGIAKRVGEPAMGGDDEGVFGSPHYMSPEQARGETLDHRSDLYSLGATLYRLLAGEPPFMGKTSRKVMEKHVFEKPKRLDRVDPSIPKVLVDLCAKLLEKKRDRRHQNASELLEDLEEARETITAPPKPRPRPTRETGRQQRIRARSSAPKGLVQKLVVVVSVLVLAGIGLLIFDYMGRAQRKYEQGRKLRSQDRLEEAKRVLGRALELAGRDNALAYQIQRTLQEVKDEIAFREEKTRVLRLVEEAKQRGKRRGAFLSDAIKFLQRELGSGRVVEEYGTGELQKLRDSLAAEAAADLAERRRKAETLFEGGALDDAFKILQEFPAYYESTPSWQEAMALAGGVKARGGGAFNQVAERVRALIKEGSDRPEAFVEARKIVTPYAYRSGVPEIQREARKLLDRIKIADARAEEGKRERGARKRVERAEMLVRVAELFTRRYRYNRANEATRNAQNALRALGLNDRLPALDKRVESSVKQGQLFDVLVKRLNKLGALQSKNVELPDGRRAKVTGASARDSAFLIRAEDGRDIRLPWDRLPPAEILKLFEAMGPQANHRALMIEFLIEHGMVGEARRQPGLMRRVRPEHRELVDAMVQRAKSAGSVASPVERDAETLAANALDAAAEGRLEEARGDLELLRTRYASTGAAAPGRLREIEAAIEAGAGG